MTLQEKVLNMQHNSFGSKRLGLPAYQWWNEALHGVANGFMYQFNTPLGTPFSYATSFPMPILTSAAFNDELVYSIATVVGREGRAFANYGQAGLDFWTPNINPFRDPRWDEGQRRREKILIAFKNTLIISSQGSRVGWIRTLP
jgi:beta-D-xylosidase 4